MMPGGKAESQKNSKGTLQPNGMSKDAMSELLKDLNEEQRKAVEFISRPLCVFAGPGTGKTKLTTYKIAYLIKEKSHKPDEVLALTFSNKAAEEMAGRVRELLPGVPGIRISTFHSFCNEVISENALELGVNPGLAVFTEEYQQAFLLENLDDLGIEYFDVPNRPIELARTFQGAIARFKQEQITVERLEEYLKEKKGDTGDEVAKLRDLARAYRAYEDFKKARGFLDFGDMQLLALRLFETKPGILTKYQEKFKYIIVDEFQDTDFIQLRIIFKLAAKGNLTVVGDDDQSIYRFRGAYLTNIHELEEFYTKLGMKPERRILNINYRCTANIQAVATRLIRNNPNRAEKDIKTDKSRGEPVQITQFQHDSDQAVGILDRIKGLNKKGCPWEDIAILVRRRIDARPIQDVLERAGIPFEIIGSREYFKEPIIRAVVAYLKTLEDPVKNGTSLGMVLQRPVHGILPGEVQKMGRYAKDKKTSLWEALGALDGFPGDKEHLQRFRKEMDGLFIIRGEKPLYEVVRTVLIGTGLFKTEIAKPDPGNIRLLNRFLRMTSQFTDIYPDAHLDEFIRHLKALADLGLEDEGWEPSAGKVHLMTVHGSKGMQFPYVIIPCLNENRFPSKFQDYKIDIPKELADGVPAEGTPEELHTQEERRLLYVGMTRGKNTVFLDHCRRFGPNKGETPRSMFLDEIGKTGDDSKEMEIKGSLEGPEAASKGLEEAIERRLASSLARKEYQKVIQAVTALAKHRKDDIAGLKVPEVMNLEEYSRELEIIEKAPELNHAKKAEYSPSKLSRYEECPKHYWFEYVLEIPGEKKTYYELGSLVHGVIETISRKIRDGDKITGKEALAVLDTVWKSSVYESREKEKQDRTDAEEMIRKFLAHQAERKGNIKNIEEWIELDLEGRKIRGRVDRIDEVGNSLEVIDYKSGKAESSKPKLKKDFQMGIYKVAVENIMKKPVARIGHWYLRSDKEVMVDMNQEERKAIMDRALEVIKSIENGSFGAVPGFNTCRYCDYQELCDRKQDE